jgi:O-antigen/teichoic acid export membrane protein
MLRYAVPLVPTALFWWVTSLSDRYFVQFIVGDAAQGVYAVSYKLPNLITLVSMIFTQAWQLSAFTEYKGPQGERFFSNIFRCYYTFVFIASSGLILLCKPVLGLLAPGPAWADAWRYTPFLVLAVAFSTLVTFLGTIYNAVHKNGMVMFTTFIGAAVNIALNWLLIPLKGPWGGPQGAAIATFASYFVVFFIRAVDSRKYIKIKMQPARLMFILGLLLLQVWVGLAAPPLWVLWEILILLVLGLSGFGYIVLMAQRLTRKVRWRRAN